MHYIIQDGTIYSYVRGKPYHCLDNYEPDMKHPAILPKPIDAFYTLEEMLKRIPKRKTEPTTLPEPDAESEQYPAPIRGPRVRGRD